MSEELRDTDLFARLTELGKRFQGIDIQFRRHCPIGWESTWRIRVLASKNERDDYRITAFGDSFDAAVIAVLAAAQESDSAP